MSTKPDDPNRSATLSIEDDIDFRSKARLAIDIPDKIVVADQTMPPGPANTPQRHVEYVVAQEDRGPVLVGGGGPELPLDMGRSRPRADASALRRAVVAWGWLTRRGGDRVFAGGSRRRCGSRTKPQC